MSVSLSKGGNVSLTKAAPNLTAVTVALGWQVRVVDRGRLRPRRQRAGPGGRPQDPRPTTYFVFFNNLRSPDGSIEHLGDNLVGGAGGDDEQINVDLSAVPPNITSVVFAVSIYEADQRRQSFGQVRGAFIRVVDRNTGSELARYDLTEEASTETAMVFGELYRYNSEWKFRAIGQGYASGLRGIALDFGVNV